MAPVGSLKAEYEHLAAARSPYLKRARDCSRYTIPALIPAEGGTTGSRLRTSYSNFGARCVHSLASKLLLAVLPARQSFFRYEVDSKLLARIGGERARADVDKALMAMESVVQLDIEATPTRTPAGEAIKHLIVAGNVLVHDLAPGIRIP